MVGNSYMPRMWKSSVMENHPDYSQNAFKIVFRVQVEKEDHEEAEKEMRKCLISMWNSIRVECWCLNLHHHTRVQDRKSEWTFARIFGSQSINSIENLLYKQLWNVGMIKKVIFFYLMWSRKYIFMWTFCTIYFLIPFSSCNSCQTLSTFLPNQCTLSLKTQDKHIINKTIIS